MPGQRRFGCSPGGGQPAGERPLQFGRGSGGPGAGPAQSRVDRRQQCGAAGDQLGLDLVPRGGGGSIGWLGRHVVGGDLGQCLAGAVEQPEHAAAGLDAHYRRQRRAPGPGPDQSRELFRYRVGPGVRRCRTLAAGRGQGQAYLVPGVRACGQFQVPARILAAGAPPQCDAGTDQPQIRSVVVDGVQELIVLLRYGGNSRRPGHGSHHIQSGRRTCGRVVFPLDLTHHGGHVLCSLTVAQPPGPAGFTARTCRPA